MKRFALCISLLAFMSFSFYNEKKTTIWLIGDSTISIKNKNAYPETGWGMPFVNFWDSTVVVENRAMNGRSTRTFREEGRWTPVVDNLSAGDYVFIQFGHNDEVPTKKSYVTEADFKKNLENYVLETKAKKAIPVLLTPVARRKFDSTGHIMETHEVYAQIVRDLAQQQQVFLIDLDAASQKMLQQYGPEASKYLFNYLDPGQHPNYPNGSKDDTHFNELGARKMAELVLAAIRQSDLQLKESIYQQPQKK